ncbi:type II secretion system minor pseudopilin [Asaia spathodeae]|uniref:General secretion pathway protein GspK n=1 Tax=Asaia spathodeae TaxID=657016 RepID=A0ABX2P5K9_9PROT|nr:general secretion pathway protein GspK [Asaia spathodeae]GBR11922.1 type III secretion component protein PulK [Asaia spathodeae NBRC 105894]
MSAKPKKHEGGFALLITLWTLAGLSFLVAMILASAGSELRETRLLRRTAQMDSLAEGGIWTGVFHELGPEKNRWSSDGTPHTLMQDGMKLTIRVQSQASRINPNIAPRPLLAALLQQGGATPPQADALAGDIVAWRSRSQNNDPNEQKRFLGAGLSYRPPHAPFQSLQELALVPGMTAPLLDRLLPHLSLTQTEDLRLPVTDPVTRAALARSGMAPLPPLKPGQPHGTSVDILVSVEDGQGGAVERRASFLLTGDNGRDTPDILRLAQMTR